MTFSLQNVLGFQLPVFLPYRIQNFFQILSLAFILKIFLKFCKFQPQYSYRKKECTNPDTLPINTVSQQAELALSRTLWPQKTKNLPLALRTREKFWAPLVGKVYLTHTKYKKTYKSYKKDQTLERGTKGGVPGCTF